MTDPTAAAGTAAYRALSQLGRPATEHRDNLRALAKQLEELATIRAGRDVTAKGAVNEMIRDHAEVRRLRDMLERENAALRVQVDQLTDHLGQAYEDIEELKAELKAAETAADSLREQRDRMSVGYDVLRKERDTARAEHSELRARVVDYLAPHVEYRLYGSCGHTHAPDDPAVVYEAPDIGAVCADGYVGSVCTACCLEPDVEPTTTDEHDRAHRLEECWTCATRRALAPDVSG